MECSKMASQKACNGQHFREQNTFWRYVSQAAKPHPPPIQLLNPLLLHLSSQVNCQAAMGHRDRRPDTSPSNRFEAGYNAVVTTRGRE